MGHWVLTWTQKLLDWHQFSFCPHSLAVQHSGSASELKTCRRCLFPRRPTQALISLQAILIPGCDSSSLFFLMMYSAYKLNKQGDSTQPWHAPFPIWSQSSSNCCFLIFILVSQRQVRWSGIPIYWRLFLFVVIHTVQGYSIVNEAEVYVFLEFSCFLCDLTGCWPFDFLFLCLF